MIFNFELEFEAVFHQKTEKLHYSLKCFNSDGTIYVQQEQGKDGYTQCNDTLFSKNNEILAISEHKEKWVNDNLEKYDSKGVSYDKKNVAKGKNTLVQKSEYEVRTIPQIGYPYIAELNEYIKGKVLKQNYTLNGVEVQAKPIGKGRYEVTMPNGKVEFVSHGGKILKAEYVRNNP